MTENQSKIVSDMEVALDRLQSLIIELKKDMPPAKPKKKLSKKKQDMLTYAVKLFGEQARYWKEFQ